ncbi:hypothetical protein V8E36_009110 [Tilletia maclaganii]
MPTDDEQQIAFSFNGTTLYDSDVQTLAEEEWLGDAIIMLLFSLLEEQAHHADIELWSPAVVQLLCTMHDDDLDPSTAESLFPPLRTFNILPISDAYASNQSNSLSSHWSLLLIFQPPKSSSSSSSKPQLTAYHFDSLDPHNASAAARCTANFASALDLYPSPVRAVGKRGWAEEDEQEGGDAGVLEAQRNAWDCGIYVLALTQALVDSISAAAATDGKIRSRREVDALITRIVRDNQKSIGEEGVEEGGKGKAHVSPAQIAHFRSTFYHWVRRWQAEARRGGGKWDNRDEVVEVLGPWIK